MTTVDEDPALTYLHPSEPEPEPPFPPSSSQPQEATWSTLPLPAAALNAVILIIGRSLELLGPYLPDAARRGRVIRRWARRNPVAASLVVTLLGASIVPLVGFVAFVLWIVGMIGVAALVIVGSVVTGVGLFVFLPLTLLFLFLALLAWAWMFAVFKAGTIGYSFYLSYEASQRALADQDKSGTGTKPSSTSTKGHATYYTSPGAYPAEKRKAAQNVTTSSGGNGVAHGGGTTTHDSATSSPVHVRLEDGTEEDYGAKRTAYGEGYYGDRTEDRVGRDIARSLG